MLLKRISVCLMIVFGILMFDTGCKKSDSGGGGSNTTTEENLAVTTNPASGATLSAQPLVAGLPLTVTVTSKMPTSGVKIDIDAKNESTSASFYNFSVTNTNATNNFTIGAGGNIPTGVSCLCSVTVTSVSKPTNKWSGSFRFSAK